MRYTFLLWLAFAINCYAEDLTDFRPSSLHSDYGVVSQVEFSTGLIGLESQMLAAHFPQAMIHFSFSESIWMIGYKTDILDARGRTPRENYLCHTFFGDQRVMQGESQEVRGLYSDAFTPEVRLPDGFGIHIPRGETFHWMPMFNNRTDMTARVRMRVQVFVIREKDIKGTLKPLYATLRSVQTPHLYFVEPGGNEKQATFEIPFNGRIHFLGTHIHPHGLYVELFNMSRGERVWRGNRKESRAGQTGAMEVYSNADGYAVAAGETYRVTAVYENPTRAPIDAMGGIYILYSRNQ